MTHDTTTTAAAAAANGGGNNNNNGAGGTQQRLLRNYQQQQQQQQIHIHLHFSSLRKVLQVCRQQREGEGGGDNLPTCLTMITTLIMALYQYPHGKDGVGIIG
mmetsp:Transcript_26622/g.38033  ORF Transcript_26622/g.38033 Transcript_26622/m.38033 type:complete len:103 (-) Transcript_26622:737-1045(-)